MTSLSQTWQRYWFDYEVRHARLVAFRVIFFGLLALDMWLLMLPHAPRYGVGGFNVGHIVALDGVLPVPTAGLIGAAYLIGGFLAARVACGVAVDISLRLLTMLYGGAYFWSQVDSYQHHYLIALLLFLCWYLPLGGDSSVAMEPSETDRSMVRSWATRLIYVEVSVVYFYTAVTKTTGTWMDGTTLQKIIRTGDVADLLNQVSASISDDGLGAYAITAHAIMLWQYLVSVSFLIPRLRPLACITGPIFHVMVEVIGLKIGWFSYYMIGIYYLFLMPDHWFTAVARPMVKPLVALRDWAAAWMPGRAPAPRNAVLLAAVTALLTLVATRGISVSGGQAVAWLLAALVGASLWPGNSPRPVASAAAQLGIVLALLLAMGPGGALFDYHRYWAGDLRRRGHLKEAVLHLQAANQAQPSGPARHFALGDLHRRLGDTRSARSAYEEGLRREPESTRGKQAMKRLKEAEPPEQ